MKKRFIVIVLDGFGIGAMDDTPLVRPQDRGANTALHLLGNGKTPLPALEKLGLYNAMGIPEKANPYATFGRSKLMHIGADTFYGHQEIMGTRPKAPKKAPFSSVIDRVEKALEAEGVSVRRVIRDGAELLVVSEAMTIGDNIEADPGQAYNLTAALDLIDFEKVLKVGRIVRDIAEVSRVIAFGGRRVELGNILSAIEIKQQAGQKYIGANAPASGVYEHDYHCIHMGYGIDNQVQVPTILGKEEIPVVLIGKVADIVANDKGTSISMVDTDSVMQLTTEKIREMETGFICTNVQETDLSGHSQDSDAYLEKLSIADKYIGEIMGMLQDEDILVVTADHGNDPTIGHSKHTREEVPLLITGPNVKMGVNIGTRGTMSDTGATICEYFRRENCENGTSYLNILMK